MLGRQHAPRSPHRVVAPPLVWRGLTVLVVAALAVLISIDAGGRARQSLESADAFRRWLELFRVERDLVYATERMQSAALYFLTTGEGEAELART